MQAFLNQFKGLSPIQAVQLESLIFNMARKMVQGYNGGNWESKKIGKTTILLIPGNATEITLHNEDAGNAVTTDHLSASAAFTSTVVNWYWWFIAGRNECSNTAHKSFQKFHDGIRADVYGRQKTLKDNGESINTDAYFKWTD